MNKCWLVCAECRKQIPLALIGRCDCGGTLLVEYDLERAKHRLNSVPLSQRVTSLWRYSDMLPIQDEDKIVSLGEGWTPLLRMPNLEQFLNIHSISVKREEQNPSGSFKARGFSVAVSLLHERGIKKVTVPSNGNAASALAAYAARANMESYLFVPKDCPGLIVEESGNYGAHVYLVDGFIHDAGRIIEEGREAEGWFNVGTLKEPGRVEGKKTMGYEIAEQLNWQLPDVIIYPTGGGSGVIGLWKAFHEMKGLGLVSGEFPRIVSVQEEGCTPIVDAFLNVNESACLNKEVTSAPTGLRVPQPPDGSLIVRILRKVNGEVVAVTKEEITAAQQMMGRLGISSSPEGASTLAGLIKLVEAGSISSHESVVMFNTSHAMKYLDWTNALPYPIIRSYDEFVSKR
ncbi:threonine synthase [Paenibacillus sp. N1-5-1-14]|uniref:threonine synthase n=1 Tax=Paenibacillus radicibacter TaxID=2972488 RepID=UPI00215963F7|nr:threonine synthase [Paenibacillus radicibacter]MCR8642090.1 threonine synthase [Paenibacillus radicibacter]